MRPILFMFSAVALIPAFAQPPEAPSEPASGIPIVEEQHLHVSASLLTVKRIYVAQLVGGSGADALRELIIASLNASKLFVLTDNPDRADATLKGADDDQTFVESFDAQEGINIHLNGGQFGSGSSSSSSTRSGGGYAGASVGENDSRHIKERKHEAYAAVRLCNREGDVLWSTSQESLGAKFRGASADVAAKIARQLTLDLERARRSEAANPDTTRKP